jgi:hypothetical protein
MKIRSPKITDYRKQWLFGRDLFTNSHLSFCLHPAKIFVSHYSAIATMRAERDWIISRELR